MKKSRFFHFLTPAFAILGMAAFPFDSTCRADEKKETKSSVRTSSSTSSVKISVNQTNDEAVVTFNDKEVWKGKVRKSIIAVAKSVDGKDLAAAFDGKKVVWENVAGAGKQLEDERKKAAKRKKKLAGN